MPQIAPVVGLDDFGEEADDAGRGVELAAFALTSSAVPQNWDWYHEKFRGSGEYASNTLRPTVAMLRVETTAHPGTRGLPPVFKASPNEWYRWKHDLRTHADIRILVSIDPASFPLGIGPKPHEIWHEGYYPVVWSNQRYRMLYVNMGHNDIEYEHPCLQPCEMFGAEVLCERLFNGSRHPPETKPPFKRIVESRHQAHSEPARHECLQRSVGIQEPVEWYGFSHSW